MGPISFFSPSINGQVSGSLFGESDGTLHELELLEGGGRMIVRVAIDGHGKSVDLLLTKEQAIAFVEGAEALLRRIGIR
jgi:hypothetical protein